MRRDSLFISLVMLVTISIWVAWAVSGLTVPTPHQVDCIRKSTSSHANLTDRTDSLVEKNELLVL